MKGFQTEITSSQAIVKNYWEMSSDPPALIFRNPAGRVVKATSGLEKSYFAGNEELQTRQLDLTCAPIDLVCRRKASAVQKIAPLRVLLYL